MSAAYPVTLAGFIALLVQFVLPLAVALVTRAQTHPTLKALTLLALSAVTELLSASLAVDRFDWLTAVANTLVGFAVSVAVHYGLWKGTAVQRQLAAVGSRQDYRQAA